MLSFQNFFNIISVMKMIFRPDIFEIISCRTVLCKIWYLWWKKLNLFSMIKVVSFYADTLKLSLLEIYSKQSNTKQRKIRKKSNYSCRGNPRKSCRKHLFWLKKHEISSKQIFQILFFSYGNLCISMPWIDLSTLLRLTIVNKFNLFHHKYRIVRCTLQQLIMYISQKYSV